MTIACHFCNIDNNPQNTVLKEDSSCQVLVSVPQKQSGHVIVIPRRHVERVDHLPPDELNQLMAAVTESQTILVDKLGNQGCDIRIHYRPFLEEDDIKVHHLHIHLIPRNQGDSFERCRIEERALYSIPTDQENTRLFTAFKS